MKCFPRIVLASLLMAAPAALFAQTPAAATPAATGKPAPAAAAQPSPATAPAAKPKPAMAVSATAERPVVYAASRDELSLFIEARPLSAVLMEIMRQSSLEVRFDPSAERTISARFQGLPLDEAITRISGGLNLVRQYRKDEKTGRNLLVSLVVLPVGKDDDRAARRLIDHDTEAGYQAGRAVRAAEMRNDDVASLRFQQRLDRLPPSARKIYEEGFAREKKQREAQRKREERAEAKAAERAERVREAHEKMLEHGKGKMPEKTPEEKQRLREAWKRPDSPEASQ